MWMAEESARLGQDISVTSESFKIHARNRIRNLPNSFTVKEVSRRNQHNLRSKPTVYVRFPICAVPARELTSLFILKNLFAAAVGVQTGILMMKLSSHVLELYKECLETSGLIQVSKYSGLFKRRSNKKHSQTRTHSQTFAVTIIYYLYFTE